MINILTGFNTIVNNQNFIVNINAFKSKLLAFIFLNNSLFETQIYFL